MRVHYAVMSRSLLQDIDTFLASKGISEWYFGYLAVKNGRLVERLREGGRIWPETEARIRIFMDEYKGRSRQAAE